MGRWGCAVAQTVMEAVAKREEEEKGNAMKALENRTQDSRVEMDIMDALEELQVPPLRPAAPRPPLHPPASHRPRSALLQQISRSPLPSWPSCPLFIPAAQQGSACLRGTGRRVGR